MVKVKKAAIGAMGFASLQPLLFGIGDDAVDAQPEVSVPNTQGILAREIIILSAGFEINFYC